MGAKCIGWVRDRKGKVIRHTYNDVCNCLTTFCGGGSFKDKNTGMSNTTPYILIKEEN